jgi:hypothetical protein
MELEELDQIATPPALMIDSGTKLHIKIEGISSIPISSLFVGMEVDEYIAIKPPAPFTSIKHKIFPGSQFVIRYLFKGAIYAFQTKVIDMISKPIRLVFMEYPKMVADRNIRSSKRTRAFIPAILKNEVHRRDVVITDISKKGCRIQFLNSGKERHTLPRKDDQVTLNCQFPGVEGERQVLGTIRNFEKKKDYLTFGVEFTDVSKDFQSIIAGYILAVEEFTL